MWKILLVVCVVLVETVLSQKRCAQVGEYCQLNSECCSGACQSFSYKCAKLQQGPPDYAPEFIVSTIDDLVNRFGGAGTFSGTNNIEPINNRFGEGDEAQRPNPPVASPSIPNIGNGNGVGNCLGTGSQCVNSNDCCSGYCSRYGNSCVTRSMFLSPCKSVGGKCFSNLDCCSGRCMIYLHQCVN